MQLALFAMYTNAVVYIVHCDFVVVGEILGMMCLKMNHSATLFVVVAALIDLLLWMLLI